MARIQGIYLGHQELKNSGDFYWITFQINDADNPAYPNLPTFQAVGSTKENSRQNMDLINIVKDLKKGEFVIIDYRPKAKPTEKYPIPFTNLEVYAINRMQSSIIKPQEPDPVPTPQPASAPPVPVQAMVDFSKPVEPLTGNLPDFTTQKSETDEPF